jgi:protein TonB
MSSVTRSAPDVFSAREIARAAGVSVRKVCDLATAGGIVPGDGGFVAAGEAVRIVRMFRGRSVAPGERQLFRPPAAARRSPGRALAASGALHASMFAAIALLTSMGLSSAPKELPLSLKAMRLVFVPLPGPGGGGGGGGLKQPAPPPRAEMKGTSALRSPVPPPRPITTRRPKPEPKRTLPPPPARPQPVERPVEPPPPARRPEAAPQVVAPVATAAADPRDRVGVLTDAAPSPDSNGPGSGGGVGTGQGTGIGEGDGAGIGPGSGGGTGGGPYRPGIGITPPSVLREVKPDYTEEARRRGVEGDVELEIVVRRDGNVGDVKLLRGLGSGLDQRATDAVRQWRFSPARRLGSPVDVVVEVAVEFKLR